MIPAFILAYLKSNWRNLIVIGAVVAALLVVYARGRHDERAKNEARHKVEVAAAMKSDAGADAKAIEVAKKDAEDLAKRKEDLIDAVSKTPDSLPDASAIALGCERLRLAGVRTADLPACRAAR